ncbi:FAD/NAD(P)-binding protein [Haloarchaeobius amylolyticus]|uniref:FAD/NAD(P)-binding protein n=1 Tax=Haloarchaeobius amylolyticus TaxID=1198296 RepID=A0ABD6BHL5_9EURY
MYEYVIVGGGVHGTCLANYLIDSGGYTHDELRIVDPRDALLASFATKARQCGMRTLRSSFVHHIDTEPFSLETFATGHGRGDELVATEDYPNRPTLELFLDHARYVIDRRDLADCHVQGTVSAITEPDHGESLRVETDERAFDTRRVVLALGLGPQPTYPEWTTPMPDDAALTHVWEEGFDPTAATAFDGRTIVVGGGITAAQLACRFAEQTHVTLLSRHDLETALPEADPQWINWGHIETHIHTLPAGSQARHDRIRNVRNDATIPPYVMDRLTDACNRGDLAVRIGEISCAHATGDGLLVRFADGRSTATVQVLLATGLEPAPDHPLVSQVAETLGLERGANGFPVLNDRTLAWRRTDGADSRVSVSGMLAETTVGPLARNVIGARRVAERLLTGCSESRGQRRTASEPAHLG